MRPAGRPLALAVLGRGLVDPEVPVVHADDAGLLRGRAAFETLRVYDGRVFALSEHLQRLALSASRLHIAMPAASAWAALALDAVESTGVHDCSLRFTLTAGRDGHDTVAMVMVLALPPGLEATRLAGISVVTLQLGIDPRVRQGAPWLLDGVKSTSYAVNMAAWDEARRRGADDAVFLAADDIVLEGPVTNIWWRRGETLFTPSLDLGVLAGVTRAHVRQLGLDAGYGVEEGWYPLPDLASADEAFSSSSVRELMPIVSVDGRPVGPGRPGDASRALQSRLRDAAVPSSEGP